MLVDADVRVVEAPIEGTGVNTQGTAATEKTDLEKAADWIVVNLPNYGDMTEVEINQALEGAGLEPVDINNDGTITSKTDATETASTTATTTTTVSTEATDSTAAAGTTGTTGTTSTTGTAETTGTTGTSGTTGTTGTKSTTGTTGTTGSTGTVGNTGTTGTTISTGKGPGDGLGDNGGNGLERTGMLTALAALPTMAQQPFEPLTQRSIRFDAPTIQPVQIAPTDARKELDNQLARLLNDPQSQRKQSLFGGLV